MARKQSAAEAVEAAEFAGYQRCKRELEATFKQEKLAQIQAVTQLLEQAGRIMSRAGYLIGKLNGDDSR